MTDTNGTGEAPASTWNPDTMSEDRRARVAAMEVVTVLLMRRLALESASPFDEIDGFRDRALVEAEDAGLVWRAPKQDVERWIRSLCEMAAARI